MKKKRNVPEYIEIVFNSLYLLTVLVLGTAYIITAHSTVRLLWGIMALTLGFGDAFHLIPRIRVAISGDKERFQAALGWGKLLTSITMTVFYVLLWQIGLIAFSAQMPRFTVLIYLLAFTRIALCLFPQNQWPAKNPSVAWGIYRNIPFTVLGGMVMWLFAQNSAALPQLQWTWLAILLSFGFYIPVVLWAHKNPKLGMLMLPKTCAYVWIVCMGLGL